MAAVTLVDIASAGAQSSSRSLQFNILPLPDPANDDGTSTSTTREYMIVSSSAHHARGSSSSSSAAASAAPYDICEIQTALPHSGKYASYFVGSRIISNPALHISTRVDPLFFALAHFQRTMAMKNNGDAGEKLEKWQPWDQALADLPLPILRALNLDPNLNINGIGAVGQLGHLLDVSDMCGDDLVLCKFSEERALKWLVAKFERSVGALRRRLHDKKRRAAERAKLLGSVPGGSGAFSSSFTMVDEEESESKETTPDKEEKKDSDEKEGVTDSTALSKMEEQSVRVGALQLICDYIPKDWKDKLSKEVGLTEEDWMGQKKTKSSTDAGNDGESSTSGEKRPRASWEGTIGQEDADAMLQYTQGGSGKSASVITPAEKNVRNAQSVGLKKLAKVNTKGMKSLSSFFGAGKKKKAKK